MCVYKCICVSVYAYLGYVGGLTCLLGAFVRFVFTLRSEVYWNVANKGKSNRCHFAGHFACQQMPFCMPFCTSALCVIYSRNIIPPHLATLSSEWTRVPGGGSTRQRCHSDWLNKHFASQLVENYRVGKLPVCNYQGSNPRPKGHPRMSAVGFSKAWYQRNVAKKGNPTDAFVFRAIYIIYPPNMYVYLALRKGVYVFSCHEERGVRLFSC